jgi:hypothetical protein
MFGLKRDEVTEDWRKLRDEELRILYTSPSMIAMRMRWEGHVAGMREKRNLCKLLVGMTEGKRPLGR